MRTVFREYGRVALRMKGLILLVLLALSSATTLDSIATLLYIISPMA